MSRTHARMFNPAIEGLESRQFLSGAVVSITAPVDHAYRDPGAKGEFLITRTGDVSAELAVPLIVGGSASNGVDYGRIGNLVMIPAGSDSVRLFVRPVDRDGFGSKYVSVMLGDVRGYHEGPRAASVAVVDNQFSAEPDYSIIRVDASRPVASRGRAGTFIITRSGDTSGSLTVPINVGGTAVNGVDIGVIGNTVTFQPGQTSVAVNVRTNSTTDGIVDLSLAQIPGAVPTTATVNISGATSTSGTTRNTLPGGLPTNVGVGVLPGGTGLTGTSTVPGGVVIDPATGLPVTVPIGTSGTGATGTTTTGGASAMPGGVPTSSSFGSTPIGFSSVTGQPIFVSNGVVTSGNNSFSTALFANSNLSLADRLLAAEILAANTTGSA